MISEQQQFDQTKWSDDIFNHIRGSKTQEALKLYVSRLILNNSVVILNFDHLAALLGVKSFVLARIIINSKSYYYSFEVPKRSGGTRNISAPYAVLLNAQKWVYDHILAKVIIHDNAKGFIKHTSIADNARVHIGAECILKMDIKDFFPSIGFKRVMSVFRNMGYTRKMSYYLSSICCMEGVLPQGAVTSPCLSNIIAKRLDARLSGLASKFNLNYTRYADDFTFSGERINPKIIEYITSIAADEGFVINLNKTNLIKGAKQKIITGISISSGELKIPKKQKREVRKCIYHILTKGLFEHQKHIASQDPIYIERLLGYLFFWKSIEPNNEFVISSIKKLKNYSNELDNTFHDSSKI